jgi:hypothetical protein
MPRDNFKGIVAFNTVMQMGDCFVAVFELLSGKRSLANMNYVEYLGRTITITVTW